MTWWQVLDSLGHVSPGSEAATLEQQSFIKCVEKLRKAILQKDRDTKPKGKGNRDERAGEREKRGNRGE